MGTPDANSVKTILIEEVDETALATEDHYVYTQPEFEFEEKHLAEAFFPLPIRRKAVLTMMLVRNTEPKEISTELHCSVEYVCRLRREGLDALRRRLEQEDESQ